MELSYWEFDSWFSNVDFTIVGSGIVGLSAALHLKLKRPKAKVLVLERGVLPSGASTKNAGFACFGSVSELLEDLNKHSEAEVVALVEKRARGLQLLRETLGDDAIGYQQHGGYELFGLKDTELLDRCLRKLDDVNELLKSVFNSQVYYDKDVPFGFGQVQGKCLYTPFEGQLNTGKMMSELLKLVQSKGVKILNSVEVKGFLEANEVVFVNTNVADFKTSRLLITTNGFASQLIDEAVVPARSQVLITKPIENLKIKGTFHMDRGYYYFRNIDKRILFGGGRNLDFKGEETSELGTTDLIQNRLEEILKSCILPEYDFEVDYRWSGIMGMGAQKKAVVKQLSNHVFCGVRLGGMGIAIGSEIGRELAELV
ncbi:NAD(P)/FAD-dependent oxidoreductase [Mangrovimonas aestuarii]|uniref:NAD(P)/FAD-dependent oxidoreductase n=1 Tax=Mangrovimonas aestuarii TaxID=3018443 RepID=UPI0023799576|nr:FAD-dependent oxidoreductase [Mangrovimonas aestuarii]